MGRYDHILSKHDLFLKFPVGEKLKRRLWKTVVLHKNLESVEFTNMKHGKPILHSLIANHVPEMSVKLKFKCVRLKKKYCFALVVLNRFAIFFYKGLFISCDLYHSMLFYHYAET